MQGPRRVPRSKAVSKNQPLNDPDINNFVNLLTSLKGIDNKISEELNNIKTLLNESETKNLILCKLLFYTGYKKEVFLHLGTIIESKLNAFIYLYQVNRWKTIRSFNDEASQQKQFNDFLKKKSLNEKADDLARFDLFNNFDSSDRTKLKIQAFRFLRNYGGHSKSINEFLEAIIETPEECEREIIDALNLVRQLQISYNNLLTNPLTETY